jgi:fluoride exporter
MQATFFVMTGGAIGAALRYHCGLLAASLVGDRWPWGTFAVNAVGALAMGLLAGWAMTRGLAEPWRLFLGVGLLGGFTTFSAFSFETWRMLEQSAWGSALLYALASVVITVLMVAVGVILMRGLQA